MKPPKTVVERLRGRDEAAGKAGITPANNGDGKERQKKSSAASLLVKLVKDSGTRLFHSPDERCYARVPRERHWELWPLRSNRFRSWLSRAYYCLVRKAPGSQALTDAITVLQGLALYEGKAEQTYIRIASHADRIYLDLADDQWRTVEIDTAGWRVIADCPVHFRRPNGVLPLPKPVAGASLDELRPLLNLRDDDGWLILVGAMCAALRPSGPYPILALAGEQGTAKSSTARTVRRIIDPSVAPLRSEPRDPRDVAIAANNGWLVALDNISSIEPWLSDCLCRLATGGGFGTRQLYTDEDEILFDAMRPVLLTSITDVATAPDLLDRTLFLRLEPIGNPGD